jgi:hypothetical protein
MDCPLQRAPHLGVSNSYGLGCGYVGGLCACIGAWMAGLETRPTLRLGVTLNSAISDNRACRLVARSQIDP